MGPPDVHAGILAWYSGRSKSSQVKPSRAVIPLDGTGGSRARPRIGSIMRLCLSKDKTMITEQKDLVSVPPLPMKIGEGPVAWMTAEQGKAIRQWVLEGGSFFAYHNSSHVSLTNKDYRDVEGAVYTGHPVIRPFKVKIVNTDHPITKGVRDFVVTDEQHFMTYDKDPKHVLARSVNEDGLEYTDLAGRRSNTAEAAWAYDYGKGRVCFLGPGHMITVLWNPEYEKMQKNAATWLLRQT